MEINFYVFDSITKKYIGQYFAETKKLANSTNIKPENDFCIWNNNQWIDTRTEIEIRKELVPESVSRRQLKLTLALNGFDLSSITTTIDALPEPNKTFAKIAWEDATSFVRNDELLIALSNQLNINDEQLDDIFINASKL